jgi:sigma-B regulation protein RsbU (phosphoserine phosphatase)
MSDKKIKDLEEQLAQKDLELSRYKSDITKLNAQLKELISQIASEIKMAAALQKALVPTEIRNIPGFDFSTKFIASYISGGDYFDIFEHEDKYRFGVMLASGSGHGMSALFLSVLMKLSGAIESRKAREPGEALDQIIKEMQPNMQPQDTAELFYGLIDRRTMILQYALCGEVVGLLFSNSEHGIVRLKTTAPSLTNHVHSSPKTETVNLESKDRLIIASKGIFGAKNPSGESFGIKRMEDAIFDKKDSNVHDLRNDILFQLEQFTGKNEPDRDQTLLVLEVKDRVIKLARPT